MDGQTDRQTNMKKLIVALRIFAKALKNCVANTVERYRTAHSNIYFYVTDFRCSMNLCIKERHCAFVQSKPHELLNISRVLFCNLCYFLYETQNII